ncbi:MAG: protein kinase [Myxococcales bacterium]|nr:protein kinase [Myxococcales bacterium]|tara:strand:+ start:113 stop:574 length:462 start_codon:yes stop_codon:yes gene_type:complete
MHAMTQPSPEILSELPLFGGVPELGLKRFTETASFRVLKEGELLYEEGDPSRELFVIKSGELQALKIRPEYTRKLAMLKAGDFFGEMSFVDMMPRSATVKATQDTEIWVWPYTLLREMYVTDMKCYTLLVMNIAREISRRLRRSDESKRSNSR